MERLLFFVALCVLSFAYGAATMAFELFPYRLLKEAKIGLDALRSVETDKRQFPEAFERFEAGAAGAPQATRLHDQAGEEHILVSGGPFQFMERCPTWGCMAWVTNRSGEVVHSWEVNLDDLWKGLDGVSGDVNHLSLYPVGMALGKDGTLVVTFQGRQTYPVHIGIAKVDRSGKLLWRKFDRSNHWIALDAEGRIYTPASVFVKDLTRIGQSDVHLACKSGEPYIDLIRVLGPQGQRLREFSILEGMLKSGYAGLFYGIRDGCDPIHLNSIQIVSPAVAHAIPGAAAGDLLVSLREMSAVALLDGESAEVKYMVAGRTAAQHSPKFLPDGTVLVFDNLGGDREYGGSRVARIDLVKGTTTTIYPKGAMSGLLPFQSKTAGHIEVSANGKRALISSTHQGQLIEIDVASGAPLWIYDNTHDLSKFLSTNGLEAKQPRARFATYGAYYVSDLAFLKEPQ